MLNYQKVQKASTEEFKAMTSLSKEEFEELRKIFAQVCFDKLSNHGKNKIITEEVQKNSEVVEINYFWSYFIKKTIHSKK